MDQVNPKATFYRDDKFKRKRYMEICTRLINNHPAERGACTIAIDAPWGVGKSTFLWMWINELNDINEGLLPEEGDTNQLANKPILPIYYNAWENDFCDSALAPLLYSICAMIDIKRDMGWIVPKDDTSLKKFISSCAGVLAMTGVKMTGADDTSAQAAGVLAEVSTYGILNLLKRYSSRNAEEPEQGSIGEVYNKQLESKETFNAALTELAQKFGGVYIFIDELDRCKPSFAIDTLDAIKHYFNIPGLTFIFGIDMLQLGHAISGRYGNNFDAEGYLSKFFEHHISLPTPTAEQMIQFCDPTHFHSADTYKRLDDIFRSCHVSPREIPRIVKASNTLVSILIDDAIYRAKEDVPFFVFTLVSMRYRLTNVYNSYINGETEWNSNHWNEAHSFGPYLFYFFPYIMKSVHDCNSEWTTILTNRIIEDDSKEWIKNMAALGKAIIHCSHSPTTDTFGQCIVRFMEQVYI